MILTWSLDLGIKLGHDIDKIRESKQHEQNDDEVVQ